MVGMILSLLQRLGEGSMEVVTFFGVTIARGDCLAQKMLFLLFCLINSKKSIASHEN